MQEDGLGGRGLTVIAYKDGVMAADTQLTDGNSACRVRKLVRLPDGGVAGGCGVWASAYAALRYLERGGDPTDAQEAGLPEIADATVLIARPDGSLWLLEGRFPAYPLLDAEMAIGSGADAARMAMSLGLSAVEAVAGVTGQDLLCGDPVQSMAVEVASYTGVVTHEVRRDERTHRRSRAGRR